LTRAASAYSIPWNQNKTGGKCRNSRYRLFWRRYGTKTIAAEGRPV
jgi:hypothetical protein